MKDSIVTHSDWMEICPVDSMLLLNWKYATQENI